MYRRRAPSGRRILGRRGQSIILLVGFLVALMGGVAASITVGTVYFAQTRLQNAVDAAALAGAQSEMDGGSANANQTYLTQQNMPQAEVTVSNLANPPNSVQALGKVTVPGSFASLFGIKQFTVRARGVAQYGAGAVFDYALFQGATSTLALSGNTHVNGSAHSNGNMALSGNDCITGSTTVGVSGSAVTGQGACPQTFVQVPFVSMPNWTLAQVTPQNATVISGAGCNSIPQNLTGNYIIDCPYSQNGPLNLTGSNVINGNILVEGGSSVSISGNAAISGSITVYGGSMNLSGNVSEAVTGKGAAFAAVGPDSSCSMSGNISVNGVVYCPDGPINISGNPTVTGAVIGNYVDVSGDIKVTYNAEDVQQVPVQQVSLIQ
ncbi:MAG: pilus assembly protein TadG-related protein [Thermaerobacter sp.]|nr:pilus assembly protein TadG-related protein [Thermaerobacter sp.]